MKWLEMNRRKKNVQTCQSTTCHVVGCKREPWAASVEKSVCPALLRTAGLESTHKSPSLQNRLSHNLSKGIIVTP